jgi:DNA-binding winged helix-turn-helix (wHTH) protein
MARFQIAVFSLTIFLIFAWDHVFFISTMAAPWRGKAAILLFSFENYELDASRRELRAHDALIPVEPQVFDLLEYLIRNRERVVSRDELIASVWGGRIVSESALNTRINAARSAIGDSGAEQRLIKTLPRKGVRFTGAVELRQQAATKPALPDTASGFDPRMILQRLPAIPAQFAAAAGLGALALIYLAVTAIGPSDPATTSSAAMTGELTDATRGVQKAGEVLVPEIVPFIPDYQRAAINTDYVTAPGHKALATSNLRAGFVTGQKDDETAKSGALDACQQATDPLDAGTKCELYAVGNVVVSTHTRPPMPPEPWMVHDPTVNIAFATKDVPLITDRSRAYLDTLISKGKSLKPWALALGQGHNGSIFYNQSNSAEAMRRSLELCGARAGLSCTIVAVDDVFVVPLPATMRATGFFHPLTSIAVTADAREELARRIGGAARGWTVVAVGAGGKPGLALHAANEHDGVDSAMADCAKQDHDCHVIAIGPFTVEPN